MAIATKRQSSAAAPAATTPSTPAPTFFDAILKCFDTVYRFFASLTLAMISLASLASVLAVGTWVESRYGTVAVQEWVYRSWWFAILLAFLATNILCAALIRYPWTKRQTGFVITHAGLLTVLAGAFWSFQFADEGQVGLLEGEKTDLLLRPDHPVIRLREIDPETQKPLHDYEHFVSFHPGARPWDPGRYELLSDPKDPFKLSVKNHLTAPAPRYLHEEVRDGVPMIKLGLMIRTPNMLRESDVFGKDHAGSRQWLKARYPGYRSVRVLGPAVIAFQHLDTEEKLNEFLHPPKDLGKQGIAIVHFKDNEGKDRVLELGLEASRDKPQALPNSDLTVTFTETRGLPATIFPNYQEMIGEEEVEVAVFKVRKGNEPELDHFGWASLPRLPNFVTGTRGAHSENPHSENRQELVHIDYLPPLSAGRLGQVEVAGMPDGRLFYRVLNSQGLKVAGPLEQGKTVPALGGGDRAMSLTLRVEQYMTSGRERLTFVQRDLPVGELGNGIPAVLAELTVDGETKEVWLQRTRGFEPNFDTVAFPNGRTFQVAYDIDRKPLGFTIALDDFDIGLDPGTQEPSSYRSDIRLSDEEMGIKDKPISISMNNTMSHRGWTFYQSNYNALEDDDGNRTGQFMSVFQVGHDPGRPLKYSGCVLVVLGAFVQFYMRAGIFTDGGKKERERAAAKAARKAKKAQAQSGDRPEPEFEPL